jgi:CBS domain-containing protein
MLCPSCGTVNLQGADECVRCQFDLAPLDLPAGQNLLEARLLADPIWKLKPRPAVCIRPTDFLGYALQLMVESGVGAVLVSESDGKLSGILTERDFVYKVIGIIDDYVRLPVSGFMTAPVETVTRDDIIANALKKMDVGGYRHLPVTDHAIPVGVISVRDVLRYVTRLCKEPAFGP